MTHSIFLLITISSLCCSASDNSNSIIWHNNIGKRVENNEIIFLVKNSPIYFIDSKKFSTARYKKIDNTYSVEFIDDQGVAKKLSQGQQIFFNWSAEAHFKFYEEQFNESNN